MVDVADCVSIIRVRAKSDSGVVGLASLMARRENEVAGHNSALPLPVITEIPNGHMHLVLEYLVEERGMTEAEASNHVSASSRSGRKCYAIEDGNRRNDALLWHAHQNPGDFVGFPWRVHIVKWNLIRILKGFARARNFMQQNEFLVQMTLFDTLRSLRDIAIEEVLIRGPLAQYGEIMKQRGFNKRVADGFCVLDNYATETVVEMKPSQSLER